MAARLILLLAIACQAQAAEGGDAPARDSDWQQRLERAAGLQADSKVRQAEADRTLEQAETACRNKFRVNACLSEVRTAHRLASREAKQLENQGKALEREVKKEQLADKDKQRAESARQRAAELEVREAETAANRAAAEAEATATRTDKARKAEDGARRKVADEERLRKKQADHEARVAEKMRKAERRGAEAAGK